MTQLNVYALFQNIKLTLTAYLKKFLKYLLFGSYNKMFCIILIKEKFTVNSRNHHFKSDIYMNRLLSLKNWDNPPIAPPLLLRNIV